MIERRKLTLAEVEALKNKGMNQSEIAEAYGVTRQYVSWIVKYYNGTQTPRQEVMEHWPWKVPAAQTNASPYKRMRDHGEYMATRGKGMTNDQLRRLRTFYRKLRDEGLVLEYDPAIAPEPGNKHGGFAFRQRTPDDGDMLIRGNEHTNITDEGRIIWSFPPEDP